MLNMFYTEGYNAYKDNMQFRDCPYNKGETAECGELAAAYNWECGWIAGYEQHIHAVEIGGESCL